jgi:hypothetical protein
MTHHVVSKGLANPSLLSRVRLRVANHRIDEERADALSAGRYSPLHAGKVSDPPGHVKHNRHSLSLMTPSRDLSISLVLTQTQAI